MAQRRIVELIDDLDQTTIDEGGTFSFSLEGTHYEIDLSTPNADRLREALAPFISAGRRTGRTSTRNAKTRSSDDLNAIRKWARKNGYTVSDRVRIATDIVAAYRAS